MKKFISISLICCLIFSLSTGVYAVESSEIDDSVIDNLLNADLSQMTKDELNLYIDQIAKICEVNNSGTVSLYTTNSEIPGMVGQAWLAAAEIARDEGYPCAATAVECSVNNVNLTESTHVVYGDGPFITKLKSTSAYQTYLSSLLASGKANANGSFE